MFKRNSIKTIITISWVVLVSLLFFIIWLKQEMGQKSISTESTNTILNNSNKTNNETNQRGYENEYMSVTLVDGWISTEATQITYVDGVAKQEPNPSTVNITGGNYILSINTQAKQASGVKGGRFGEIAQGISSADAVVTAQPNDPCGVPTTVSISQDQQRTDWYVNKKDAQSWCVSPVNDTTVWYFSYIGSTEGGYFNYYKQDESLSYVITMAYDSKEVNTFPEKGSVALDKALAEMTEMVGSLKIKQQ